MKKIILLIFFCPIFIQNLIAQACDNPKPTDNPCTAPLLCTNTELDNFCGKMESTFNQYKRPNGFCSSNSSVDNPRWLRFVAQSSTLQLRFTYSNCGSVAQNGLQAVIYSIPDCADSSTYTNISNCLEIPSNQTTGTITATNLVANQTYYLLVDGVGGGQCDYLIDVIQGSIKTVTSSDLPTPDTLYAPTEVCYSAKGFTVAVPKHPNAEEYIFDIQLSNGTTQGGSQRDSFFYINGPFPAAGNVVFTVKYKNKCSESLPTNPATINFGNITDSLVNIVLSKGQSYILEDPSNNVLKTYTYGPTDLTTDQTALVETFRITDPDGNGCDLVLKVTVTRKAVPVAGKSYFLRPSQDSVQINGTYYTSQANSCTPIYIGKDTIYNAQKTINYTPLNPTLNCDSVNLRATITPFCSNLSHKFDTLWYFRDPNNNALSFISRKQLLNTRVVDSYSLIIRDSVYLASNPAAGYNLILDTINFAVTGISSSPFQPGLINNQFVSSVTICQGATQTYTVSRGIGASNHVWTLRQNSGTITAINDTTISILWNQNALRDTIRVIAVNKCGSSSPRELIVNFVNFTNLNAGRDTTVCGTSYTFRATSALGSGTWRMISGTGTSSFGNVSSPTSTVTVSAAGVYNFEWRENNTTPVCSKTDTVQVTFNAPPQFSQLNQTCSNDKTQAFIGFRITGGAAPYAVYVSGTNALAGTVDINNVFQSNGFSPGAYSFDIRDNNSCVSTVAGNQLCTCGTIAGQMQPDKLSVCAGDSARGTYITGSKILEPGDTSEFVLHSGDPRTGILQRNTSPSFAFDANTMKYETPYYISIIAGNDSSGHVELNDKCFNASSSKSVEVIFHTKPQVALSTLKPVVCAGSCSELDFGVTGKLPITVTARINDTISRDTTFVFNANANIVTYCPPTNSTWNVIYASDANSCTDSIKNQQLNISISIPVEAGTGRDTIFCSTANEIVSLPTLVRGGASGGTWQEISTTPSVGGAFDAVLATFKTLNQPANTYKFIYVVQPPSGSACPPDTATVNVKINPSPVAEAGPSKTITCSDPLVTIGDSARTSFRDVRIVWSGSGFNGNTPTLVVTQPGNYTITVSNTDGSCPAMDSVTVLRDTAAPIARLIAVSDTLNCVKDTIQLNGIFSTNPSGDNVSYLWSLNGAPFENNTSALARIGGNYTLTVTRLANGCSSTAEHFIFEDKNIPTVNIVKPDVLSCKDTILQLDGTKSSTGNNFTYSWSTSSTGNIVSGNSTLQVSIDRPGRYSLAVTNNINGCKDSTFVNVSQDTARPIIQISEPDTLDCANPTINISANGSAVGAGLTYLWTPNPGHLVSGERTLNPVVDEPGIYELLVTNLQNGCIIRDTVEVFSNNERPQDADILLKKPSCYGEGNGSINVNSVTGGTQPFIYSLDGKVYTTRNSFTNLKAGIYKVFVQDAGGCQITKEVTILEDDELTVFIGADTTIQLGDSVVLTVETNADPIKSIAWSSNTDQNSAFLDSSCLKSNTCRQQIVKPNQRTTYYTRITDANGCQASTKVTISIDKKRPVFIPTAFNPTTTSPNNIFMIYGSQVVKKINSFSIYDRWGGQVFAQKDFLPDNPANGWNGEIGGKLAVPGVYTYFVEIEYLDGRKDVIEGDVTLLR